MTKSGEKYSPRFLFKTLALVNSRKAEITLQDDKISINYSLYEVSNLRFSNIINISHINAFNCKGRFIKSYKTTSSSTEGVYLYVYSVIRSSRSEYQLDILVTQITFSSVLHCNKWMEQTSNILAKSTKPKNLLVFINPVGGFKKGVKLYNEKVEPIFRLAGITTEVIVTQTRDEAKDKLLKPETDMYDGIVCVGGDGMLMEVIHGLLIRGRRERGIDDDDHGIDSNEYPTLVPVGIIPAGSTDAVAHSIHGTKDTLTSALQIVLGDQVAVDVLGVYSNDKFLKYNVSLMGYGFYGNVIANSESLRWMGPSRYDWLGFKNFLNLESFCAEIRYQPANKVAGLPTDGVICSQNCVYCTSPPVATDNHSKSVNSNNDNNDWVCLRGRFVAVNSFLLSCRCRKSQFGPAPFAHISNGYSDIIIVEECSRFKFLHHLMNTSSSRNHLNFDFIKTIRASQFTFRLLDPTELLMTEFDVSSRIKLNSDCDSVQSSYYSQNSNSRMHSNIFVRFTMMFSEGKHYHHHHHHRQRKSTNSLFSLSGSQYNNNSGNNNGNNNKNNNNNTRISSNSSITSSSVESQKSITKGNWNCDGEPLYANSVHCKVHRQLIKVFSRGMPSSTEMINLNNSTINCLSDSLDVSKLDY